MDVELFDKLIEQATDIPAAFELARFIKSQFPLSDDCLCYFSLEWLPNGIWQAGFTNHSPPDRQWNYWGEGKTEVGAIRQAAKELREGWGNEA